MGDQTLQRVSPLKEWLMLTRQFILILFNDRKNLLLSLVFPVIAALITVFVAGENMFRHFDGTKSGIFVVVSAAIWGGLFNSIQTVVRERENIKRDHAAGLRLGCYTASRAVVQLALCLIQSALLTCAFVGVDKRYGNDFFPETGVLEIPALLEFYITIALLTFSADAMGMFLSSMVKKPESANVLAPYILIVQLIFSGVLFSMEGGAKILSFAMLSRWGMAGLGTTADLNNPDLPMRVILESDRETQGMLMDLISRPEDEMFTYEAGHLLVVWLVLLAFSVGFLLLGNLCLRRVAKDTR